jgi:PAS domain S-box-containing protein
MPRRPRKPRKHPSPPAAAEAAAAATAAARAAVAAGALDITPSSLLAAARLSHELEVQQDELEIQNRQLVESQRLLEESRDRYASLYDFAPVAYVTLDTSGLIRDLNMTAANLLGESRARLMERPFVLFIVPEYRRSYLGHLNRCRSTSQPLTTELMLRRRDGSHLPVELRTSDRPLESQEGMLYLSVLIDLSERIRLEQERQTLRESSRSEQLLRATMETLPVAVRVVGTAGKSLLFNEACRVLWGLSAGAPLPAWDHQTGWDPITHRRLAAEQWPVAQALKGQSPPLRQMIHAQGFDGHMRVVMQSAVPLLDEHGMISGAIEVTEDVSRLMSAQEAAQQRREQLEAAFDAAHLSFWDWNLATNKVIWSGPFEKLFAPGEGGGDGGGETVGRSVDFLRRVHVEDAKGVQAAIADARRHRSTLEHEFRVVMSDNSIHWLSAKGRFTYHANGLPLRMTGVVTDITARKTAELEVRRAKEAAEEASRLKDDFLATVSHELRTPLSAILLWTHLARTSLRTDGERNEALDTILSSAKSQSQIVEDLLDISRGIAGKLRLELVPTQLFEPVRAALDSVRPSAENRQIRLVAKLETALPPAQLDPDRIRQVAWNLLTNAIKFTPPGGVVTVSLSLHEPLGGPSMVRLTVADTGQGITKEFLPHVFDRFRQAESGFTRQQGGLGLGLAIARELVQMHGGTIRAETGGPGLGATFTVDLPLRTGTVTATLPSAAGAAVAEDALAGKHILLVEDDDDTRAALDRVLGAAGASVKAAPSAAAAVAAFQAGRPDVLVSDIAMPEQDGYALLRRLRKMEAEPKPTAPRRQSRAAAAAVTAGASPSHHHTPALALTAHARPEDRAKAIAAGFEAHLAKPVDPDQLISTVAALCHAGNGGGGGTATLEGSGRSAEPRSEPPRRRPSAGTR